MKATLIKTNLFIIAFLFLLSCENKEFKAVYNDFEKAVENKDIEFIKSHSTNHGIKRLEYLFGDISKKGNIDKLFYYVRMSDPYFKSSGDSIIYVLSNKPTGDKSANTLTFIRKEKKWLLNDYRQGK